MKEHITNWTDATCEVVGIDKSGLNGQTTCKLEGWSKGYFRNELLWVEWINCLIFQFIFYVNLYTI